MLKKITNSLMVLILLVTTTGITYHYHYCCNTLIKFSILHTPKPCCEHPENCCRDESVTLQLKNDSVFSFDFTDLSAPALEIPMVITELDEVHVTYKEQIVFPEESPPPYLSVRLSQLQQYLI